jgi:hypothetical protein
MKKLIATAAVAACLAAPSLSFAFGLPPIPGIGGGSSSSGGAQPDLSGQQTALVKNFVAANTQVLQAQGRLLAALQLKQEAAKADETAKQYGSGATEGGVKDTDKVVADSSGAIAAELAKEPVLDSASKGIYAEGLAHLVTGTIKYAGLGKDVKDMGSNMKGASPLALAKLTSAAYVVSNFPGSASKLYTTLKQAIAFAKKQGIAMPPNADDALGALGALGGNA